MNSNISEHQWRWMATPLAALGSLLGSAILLMLLSWGVDALTPLSTLIAFVPAELRAGLFGATVAITTVVTACRVAPSRRAETAIVVFAVGAWLAWLVLGNWYFPEGHPKAYQPSRVPYAITMLGGLAAVTVTIFRERAMHVFADRDSDEKLSR